LPAITPKVLQAEKHIEDATPLFPVYVQEYIRDKKSKYSPLTLSGYLYNIEKFLNWLLEEGIVDAKNIRDIHYESLSTLAKLDVELFVDKMASEILSGEDDNEPKRRSKTSVARAVQALKSLFRYLTVETEDKVNVLKRKLINQMKLMSYYILSMKSMQPLYHQENRPILK